MQRRLALTRCITQALALSAVLAAGLSPLVAQAQSAADYPNKPVKIIVPFPPGGTSDVMARLVGGALSNALGQQFVIENIGGAGGLIGTARAAKMAPDGYTVVLTGVGSNAVMHGLTANAGYDSTKEFVPLGQIHSAPSQIPMIFLNQDAVLPHAKASPEIRDRLESQGFVVPPAGGAHHGQSIGDEMALWSRVIKSAGIKAE
jgi:tripartite-type tricarboxylate transporter receptor subunit TctC